MLTGKQKQFLKGLAHDRNPILTIGQSGLTDAVLNEAEIALAHHELIKVKLPALSKLEKQELLGNVEQQTNSNIVQIIGRVGVLYRAAKNPIITLPS